MLLTSLVTFSAENLASELCISYLAAEIKQSCRRFCE